MTVSVPAPTRRSEFWAGARSMIPLLIGAVPFGFIFGVTAINSGISPLGAMGMSLFVFAGSSQFVAAQLVAQGAGLALIILTTAIVNIRHALYSATLAPHMKHLSQRWLLPLGFWLTDETFVMVVTRYNRDDASPYKHWYHLGSAVSLYVNWQLSTLIGLIAGQQIPDLRRLGLDFALVVTFIGMVVPQLRQRPMLMAATVAGISAVLLHGLPNQAWLIVSTLLGVAAGVLADRGGHHE
ncbi:MAG: AzlC family ABC transporter permease [Anaerolineae bacterium]|nr:AzlC family ABC transporter permease [Anaerolineae bacterium]